MEVIANMTQNIPKQNGTNDNDTNIAESRLLTFYCNMTLKSLIIFHGRKYRAAT